MKVMHLTTDTYTALLDRTLPRDEAQALAAHLEDGCDVCESWLAEQPVADRLDGVVDASLGSLASAERGTGE